MFCAGLNCCCDQLNTAENLHCEAQQCSTTVQYSSAVQQFSLVLCSEVQCNEAQCTVHCNSAEKSAQLGAVQEVNRGTILRGERSSGGVECLVWCSFVHFTGVLSIVGQYVGVQCTVGQCSVVQCSDA